jgi:hypothetical protein
MLTAAAVLGLLSALESAATALLDAVRLVSYDPSGWWHTVDVLTPVLLAAGLAALAAMKPATGWLMRIGVTIALAGLGVFTLASALAFSDADAGEKLHPISVPVTAIGMLIIGVAVVRAARWRGWRRFAPLGCGVVPFTIELPGFLSVGDTPRLGYFIACTWTAWALMFIAALLRPAGAAMPTALPTGTEGSRP